MGATEVGYASWPTPITSELVVAEAVRLSDVQADGADVLWSEGRPSEGGRTQLVRLTADGSRTDLLPDGANARTAVHEYGGGAWWAAGGIVWFTDWSDQRLYRREPSGELTALSPKPATPRGDRFADGQASPDGRNLVCVRERHEPGGAVRNEIIRLAAERPSEPEVLVTGPDFVAAPRLAGGGRALCWLQWEHPNMPWDDVTLMVRDLEAGEENAVAGGPGESVTEPCWAPDGSLWFLSDRTNFWSLYRWDGAAIVPVVEVGADIGEPAWSLGGSRYAVLPSGAVVFARWCAGYDGIAVRTADGRLVEPDLPFSAVQALRPAGPGAVVLIAASPRREAGVYRLAVPSGHVETLRPPRQLDLDPGYLSAPEAVEFPSVDATGAARSAYALLYPPANPACRGPVGELPPLLVKSHGGPTGKAVPALDLGTQYWTSRGFTVVDVDYAGSAGYGRAYRQLLHGQWGILDVADCLAAARWLAGQGRVDPERLCIRGGSAGGYTTLAALARTDTPFAAGADHFGVADLEALARHTHKFESRYLDRLVGPYPETREVYRRRSPIQRVERFTRPLIVLQGAEDAVVPPRQSEMIVRALRAKGVAVAYLLFGGEQHGFRRAEHIRRALDAELSFYARVLGFELPPEEAIEPVPILGGTQTEPR
jgi:dipeptidyl aminopeptidase/acylaminoacyl peptidase